MDGQPQAAPNYSQNVTAAEHYERCGQTALPRNNADQPMLTAPLKQRIREIVINPVDSGFVVRVGCQTIAVESSASLISRLSAYISEPARIEALYDAGKLF